MSEIYAKHGKVVMTGDAYDDELPPAEARDYARRILAAADEADHQHTQIIRACTDGHAWNTGHNNWGSKETTYHCTRPGCDGIKGEPGWLPFEPKTHIVSPRGTTAECTGPGCWMCDNEALGKTIRKLLREGAETFDRSLFAPASPHEGGQDQHGGY